MPKVSVKKPPVLLIILLVVAVAFGLGVVAILIWKVMQQVGLAKRLQKLRECTSPPAPTNVVAVASTTATNTINLTWTAVPGASSYRIITISGNGGAVTASNSTSTSATIIVSGPGDYELWVHSIGQCNDGSTSTATSFNIILGTVPAVSIPMVSPPSNVAVVTIPAS